MMKKRITQLLAIICVIAIYFSCIPAGIKSVNSDEKKESITWIYAYGIYKSSYESEVPKLDFRVHVGDKETYNSIYGGNIKIYIDNKYLKTVNLNNNDSYEEDLPLDGYDLGVHSIKIEYLGNDEYKSSQAEKEFFISYDYMQLIVENCFNVYKNETVSINGIVEKNVDDEPFANVEVEIFVNDIKIGATRTGDDGRFSVDYVVKFDENTDNDIKIVAKKDGYYYYAEDSSYIHVLKNGEILKTSLSIGTRDTYNGETDLNLYGYIYDSNGYQVSEGKAYIYIDGQLKKTIDVSKTSLYSFDEYINIEECSRGKHTIKVDIGGTDRYTACSDETTFVIANRRYSIDFDDGEDLEYKANPGSILDIKGSVRDFDGYVADNQKVEVYNGNQLIETTNTDNKGVFELKHKVLSGIGSYYLRFEVQSNDYEYYGKGRVYISIEDDSEEQESKNNESKQTEKTSNRVIKKPAKAMINKIAKKKKSSKKLTIAIKKTNGAKGYQVKVYTSSKNAKKNKKAILTKIFKKTKFTLNSNKLKKKKKLFIRVRAFNYNQGKRQYGLWSKVMKVKIKE